MFFSQQEIRMKRITITNMMKIEMATKLIDVESTSQHNKAIKSQRLNASKIYS